MSDNVINLGMVTRLDLPIERVLDEAKGIVTGGVVVIGFDSNGDFYGASSIADGGEVMWLLEKGKHKLLTIADALEGGE